jgi:hypothetical protein
MPHAAPADAAPRGQASAIRASAVLDTPGELRASCSHSVRQLKLASRAALCILQKYIAVCNGQTAMRFCCQELCCHAHSTAGSHLQREVLAAEDDTALLALVRRSARQQRYTAQQSCGEDGNGQTGQAHFKL